MTTDIVLIHGWGTQSYNQNLNNQKPSIDIAWKHRSTLIKLLSSRYNIHYFNLPGFCGVPEPNKVFFNLDNFTNYFSNWLKDKNLKSPIIIGYSFGGAIALNYKVKSKLKTKIILISPALKRKMSKKSGFASLAKNFIPQIFFQSFKSLYQYLFSSYYRQGTPFLRKSYDSIVRLDLKPLLQKAYKNEILLIYGESDTSTPVEYVKKQLDSFQLPYHIIPNGDHNIGETHPQELSIFINQFVSLGNNLSKINLNN